MSRSEIPAESTQSINESISESEKIRKVINWTIPPVEVFDLVVPQGETAIPLPKEVWIVPLAEVSRIRGDSQNEEGVRLGYYPQGFIASGEYTYSPSLDEKKKKPKYSPRIFNGVDAIIQEKFPRTQGIHRFAEVILGENQEPITRIEMSSVIEWARLGYKLFGNERLGNPRHIEVQDGIPVLVFSKLEDLQNFRPYRNSQLPENTQAVSYFQSPGTGEEGTPVIVCHESCSMEDRSQHIRTLMTFAQALDPKEISPILVSKFTPTLEDYLHLRIREMVLGLIIREKKVLSTDWFHSDAVSHAIEAAKGELFKKHLRMETQRPFFIDDWPDIRKTHGTKYQDVIGGWLQDEMMEAFLLLDEGLKDIPAREILLAKINIYSLLPDWREASRLMKNWEGKHDYIDSFGIPYKKSDEELSNVSEQGIISLQPSGGQSEEG